MALRRWLGVVSHWWCGVLLQLLPVLNFVEISPELALQIEASLALIIQSLLLAHYSVLQTTKLVS